MWLTSRRPRWRKLPVDHPRNAVFRLQRGGHASQAVIGGHHRPRSGASQQNRSGYGTTTNFPHDVRPARPSTASTSWVKGYWRKITGRMVPRPYKPRRCRWSSRTASGWSRAR